MKLEEMKYFVEIVKARSINQASKTLFVAQPALSRMLTALEKELGFPLLERSKHGITPTKAGLAVYADCVKILQLYNDSKRRWQDIAYETADTCTTVRIVALPMICNSTMNQVFCEVAQKYPRIQLKLFERQLQDVLQETISQSYTIGISHYNEKTKDEIYQFAKTNQMQIIPLFDDEYKFFAGCNHPLIGEKITSEDFKECTIANYSSPETENMPQFIDAGLTGFLDKFKQVLYLSNRYIMMETAATTQAITLSADCMTRDNIYRKNGNLVPLNVTDFYLPMTYFMMMRAEPSIEENIVADILRRYYLALAEQK